MTGPAGPHQARAAQELVRQQRSIEQDAAQAWRGRFGAGAKRGLLRTDSAYERCQPMLESIAVKPVCARLAQLQVVRSHDVSWRGASRRPAVVQCALGVPRHTLADRRGK